MIGERAIFGSIFDSFLHGKPYPSNPLGWRAYGVARLLLLADYHTFLTSFPLSVELKQIVEGGNEKDSEFPAYAFLTRALVPTYGQISKKTMQALLERRLMRYTLELRRHRVRTGSYPATLDELVTPEGFPDPVDPIDEKPLVYERKGSGFRLTVARRKVWWSSSKDEESFEQGVIILSR